MVVDGLYGVYCNFQQYFSYIMAVSSIGGRKRDTQRKLPPIASQVLSHNVASSSPRYERDSNSELITPIVV